MATRSRTALLTLAALVAFAANSVLTRRALGAAAIDPARFAAIRLGSGAAMLLTLRLITPGRAAVPSDPLQPLALLAYAVAFTNAYVALPAGTGALLLFGSVQAMMVAGAVARHQRFGTFEIAGLLLALGGLAWLVAPGIAAPPPAQALLMCGAGVAWGVYTLRGRDTRDPLGTTTRNFALAVPPAVVVAALAFRQLHVSPAGAALAAASGAITSGLGYVLWFAALRGLTAIRAAVVQLAVPLLAAAGGVALLGEHVTTRLALSAVLILGGIALAISMREARGVTRTVRPRGSSAAPRPPGR